MISFLVTMMRFFRAVGKGLKDSEFRALLIAVVVTLLSGTIFYSYAEGWSPLDALYFSVITLTTVGYGDLAPTTPLSKIFTIVYIFVGVGIFLLFINKLAVHAMRRKNLPENEDDKSS